MNVKAEVRLHRVGAFLVDPNRNLLKHGDQDIRLEPKVMDVLCELIKKSGQVISRDELIEQVWGQGHYADEGLTRNISILRSLFRQEDSAVEYIQTVSKRGYRLAQPTEAVFAPQSAQLADKVLSTNVPTPVLAVLAFDNLSRDEDLDCLSDGVSEEILLSVAQGTDLKVIGRASSFRFRGADKAAGNVASKLRVSHVLDGSLQIQGERLRIHAELIECDTETVVWTQRFDRERADLFVLEDEIASAVAGALRTTFEPSESTPRIDPEAHDLFLKARAQVDRQWGTPGIIDALPLYEAAVAKAPEFARAWALLAQCRAHVLRGFPDHRPAAVTHASVMIAAATALRLDPNCGVAYLALNALEASASYTERKVHIEQALAAAPNDPEIIMAAANLAARVGRIKEALSHAEKARDIDPMFPVAGYYCATMTDFDGRYLESRDLSDELLETFPDVEYMWVTAALLAAVNADWERLASIGDRLHQHGPIDRIGLVLTVTELIKNRDPLLVGKYIEHAQKVLEKKGYVDLRVLNAMYRMGAWEKTFELVELSNFAHMFDPMARPPAGWASEAIMFNYAGDKAMLADPRFVKFCAKLGLCDYWVKSDNWPDCADYDFLPYDFRAAARVSIEG